MIYINGTQADPHSLESLTDGLGGLLIDVMSQSEEKYEYTSVEELRFEIELRQATVNAAKQLHRSKFRFATFNKSKCNPEYWDRASDGGFRLKPGARPSEAVADIFENSSMYATECATAMMIVFYKAVLDVYPASLYDRTFKQITLMNWHTLDPLFRSVGVLRKAPDFFPGDRMYFINPDVNPAYPEWQGENVIMLAPDSYYGHGVGIGSEAFFISTLNKERWHNAERSAFLIEKASRPNYNRFFELLQESGST